METGFEVTKGLFGQHHVSYHCPHCGDDLRSPLAEAGKPDTCPNCNARFIVPGAEHLRQIQEQKQAKAHQEQEAAERRREEKLRKQNEAAEAAASAQMKAQQRRELHYQDQLREQKEKASARAREMEAEAFARQQREREMRESRKCSSCGAEVHGDAQFCDACQTAPTPIKQPGRRAVVGVFLVAIALVVPLPFGYSWVRNSGLQSKLDACESSGVIQAKVTYEGFISNDGVVFDILDGGSASARRIDSVHLLLQFAGKLDLYSVQRVVLARNGRQVFYVSSTRLRPLADSYPGGGRVWSFNHLPESVRTMSGDRAYGEWSGGWLGVLKKQSEDVNDFIREWTGY